MSERIVISAVICSYNRARFIIDAIESVFNQEFDKNLMEVIVVDNNSSDNTIALLNEYKLKHPEYNFSYFIEKQQGVAHARTRCAKEAKGKYIAYLDDDSKAQKNWLKNIVEFFNKNSDVYSIGGKITPYFLTSIPDWYSKYFFGLVGKFDQGTQIKELKSQRYPCGANMAFRKEVFDEIGYFNTALGRSGTGLVATEEKDIYLKILKHGKRVFYLPEVEVLHAVESNKFDKKYVHKHSMGIGAGERLRLKNDFVGQLLKLLEYKAKWAYAVLYGLSFLAKGQWTKFVMLERFRWWVIIGFLFPQKAK